MEKENIFFFERGYFFLFAIFVSLVGFLGSLMFFGLIVEEYFSGQSKCSLLSRNEIENCIELSRNIISSYMIHASFVFAISVCGISLMHMCVSSNSFYKISEDPNEGHEEISYKSYITFAFLFHIFGIVFLFSSFTGGNLLRWYTTDMILISSIVVIISTAFILRHKDQVELREEEIKE